MENTKQLQDNSIKGIVKRLGSTGILSVVIGVAFIVTLIFVKWEAAFTLNNVFKWENSGWVIAQSFSLASFVVAVLLLQFKSKKNILLFKIIAMILVVVGQIFVSIVGKFDTVAANGLFNMIPAIWVSFASGLGIYLIYKPSKNVKLIGGLAIAVVSTIHTILVQVLVLGKDIDALTIISIIYMCELIIAFTESTASKVRKYNCLAVAIGIIFYFVSSNPINAVNQIFNLVSCVIGIVRLDLNKNKKEMVSIAQQSVVPTETIATVEKETAPTTQIDLTESAELN